MTDIIDFLRARLADDEQIAKACGDLRWSIETTMHRERESEPAYPVAMVNPVFIDTYTPDGMTFDVADCQYAARWDPARVLAEVEAKRRIIDECEKLLNSREASSELDWAPDFFAHDVLRLLAVSYRDHLDYDAAWALNAV